VFAGETKREPGAERVHDVLPRATTPAKTVPSDSNERNTFNFATFMLDADEPKRGILVLVVQYSSLF
jgi:hypothetical protein